jgi:hypothetical protein
VRPALLASALLALSAAFRPAAAEPALADLTTGYHEGALVFSVHLVDGLSPDHLDGIESGIETTVEYRVQAYRRRSGMPDDLIVRRRIECVVHRDALTRQYLLTRRVDGELVERRVTADAVEMTDFLTRLAALPIARRDEIPPGEDLYLRARSDLGLIWRFYLIPWPLTTGWVKTLIPASPAPDPERPRERRN